MRSLKEQLQIEERRGGLSIEFRLMTKEQQKKD